jgi:hypothetical protein
VSSDAWPQTGAAAPAAGGGPGDLQWRYAAELAARHFARDPDQLAVLARLEELRRRLLESAPRNGIVLRAGSQRSPAATRCR